MNCWVMGYLRVQELQTLPKRFSKWFITLHLPLAGREGSSSRPQQYWAFSVVFVPAVLVECAVVSRFGLNLHLRDD